jgi:hypothetical protein
MKAATPATTAPKEMTLRPAALKAVVEVGRAVAVEVEVAVAVPAGM